MGHRGVQGVRPAGGRQHVHRARGGPPRGLRRRVRHQVIIIGCSFSSIFFTGLNVPQLRSNIFYYLIYLLFNFGFQILLQTVHN